MKITPALIPHSEFHTGIWLQSVARPSWYYFKKRKYNPNKITSRTFLSSVDQPLRRLVKFLYTQNIRTTPSCSGHNIHEKDFEKIYPDLEMDAVFIRNAGLKMKDVETGKTYMYRNENYKLPWTKREFLKELDAYQHKGVIGLHLGRRRKAAERILHLKISGVRIKKQKGTMFIFTNENRQSDIKAVWKEITDSVIEVLKIM